MEEVARRCTDSNLSGAGVAVREEIFLQGFKARLEDLPEHLPSPLISKQEAEALVGGEVSGSHLVILSPDSLYFQPDKPSFQDPCWAVSSREGGDLDIPRVTVINAMTGEVLGRYSPC